MTRLGVFGGTFDPVHIGHLDVARAAAHALHLARVLFMPANVPPHRDAPWASAAHRFAMAALAVVRHDDFAVDNLEMLSIGPSYTSTTLDRLAARGINTDDLFLITGADAFRDIGSWRGYPAFLERCHFVVVSRPDCPASSLRAALPELSGRMIDVPSGPARPTGPSVILVDAPTARVSSTDVRRRIAGGESVAGLVPDLVARHIEQHQLYRPPAYGQS